MNVSILENEYREAQDRRKQLLGSRTPEETEQMQALLASDVVALQSTMLFAASILAQMSLRDKVSADDAAFRREVSRSAFGIVFADLLAIAYRAGARDAGEIARLEKLAGL